MISKELLGEVLEINIDENDIYIKNNYIYYAYCRSDNEWINASSNIYELAHKCKEWAYKQDYDMWSITWGAVEFQNNKKYNGTERITKDTEIEAIIEACQWILDNKED